MQMHNATPPRGIGTVVATAPLRFPLQILHRGGDLHLVSVTLIPNGIQEFRPSGPCCSLMPQATPHVARQRRPLCSGAADGTSPLPQLNPAVLALL